MESELVTLIPQEEIDAAIMASLKEEQRSIGKVDFYNEEHHQNFLHMIEEDQTRKGDVERYGFFYVISGSDYLYSIRQRLYNPTEHIIAFDSVEEAADIIDNHHIFYLFRRALHLYNSYHEDISTHKLLSGLDKKNAFLVINCEKIISQVYDFEF